MRRNTASLTPRCTVERTVSRQVDTVVYMCSFGLLFSILSPDTEGKTGQAEDQDDRRTIGTKAWTVTVKYLSRRMLNPDVKETVCVSVGVS